MFSKTKQIIIHIRKFLLNNKLANSISIYTMFKKRYYIFTIDLNEYKTIKNVYNFITFYNIIIHKD